MRIAAGWGRLGVLAMAVILTGAGLSHSPLVDAAKKADGDAVRALLAQGVDVNATEGDGATALHWASFWDDLGSAELLIRAGADVNVANDLGATPLWPASLNGSSDMVRLLLDAGANPSAALLSGETLVMTAARSGNADVVRQLLERGADPNATGTRSQTALMWAAAQKHAAVVEVLLEYGADVHARSDVWTQVKAVPPTPVPANQKAFPHGNNTALMFAARVGDLASAKLLVAAGADVNDADAWGMTALAVAAHEDFAELVEFLLEQGADPNSARARAAGFTPLHAAVMRWNERAVAALLAHGADPDAPLLTWTPTRRSSSDFHFHPAWVGATPFWLAARYGTPRIMRLLAEFDADPLVVHHGAYHTGSGIYAPRRVEMMTALMAAVGMGGPGRGWVVPDREEREAMILESVELAVELGVDVNARNSDGSTALDHAMRLGLDRVVEFLLENGARGGQE